MASLATSLVFPLGGIPPQQVAGLTALPYGPFNAMGATNLAGIAQIGPTNSTPPTAGVIIQVFPDQL